MGLTKSEQYGKRQNTMAGLFKALGHPARVAIIEYLIKSGSCICGEIVDAISLAQPTVSQHLRELKQAGLIRGTVKGNTICYCLEEKEIDRINLYFDAMIKKIRNKTTLKKS